MPSADLIIALGKDGVMTEQGSFTDLSHSGGYVEELLRNHADLSTHSESSPSVAAVESELAGKKAPGSAKAVAKPEDKRRQLGDITVYRYYFGSIGTVFLVVLILLELLAAFFSTYPSECNLSPPLETRC